MRQGLRFMFIGPAGRLLLKSRSKAYVLTAYINFALGVPKITLVTMRQQPISVKSRVIGVYGTSHVLLT